MMGKMLACVCQSFSLVQLCCSLMDCSLTGLSVHEVFQARILDWVAKPSSRRSSQPRDQTQVSCTAGRFVTSEPQRKPKNTGVTSLSFLQWTLPIQELNQGLLHCRWILYQLSHQRRPSDLCILFPNPIFFLLCYAEMSYS